MDWLTFFTYLVQTVIVLAVLFVVAIAVIGLRKVSK